MVAVDAVGRAAVPPGAVLLAGLAGAVVSSTIALPGFGQPPKDRTLYYGDCLDWMQLWDTGSVDLIYLDPPFNSNATYNVLYRDRGAGKAQYRAFDDTWHWSDGAETRLAVYQGAGGRPAARAIQGLYQILGRSGMLAYLTYMAERLEQCHRILKPTGSIFLHCDPTANAYLRVLMSAIFGANNFRNEIVWCYRGPGSPKMRQFNRKHDTIFWYSRGAKWTFNRDAVRIAHHKKTEANYKSGLGGSGFADTPLVSGKVPESWWAEAKGNGLCIVPKSPRQYLGYPTQKPRALLERIITAASNPGDLVLDPFCGCGTAVDAANRLGRRWAGIDISSFAIDLIRDRRMGDPDIDVQGTPFDLRAAEKLAREKPFEFESWAIMRMPGFIPNTVRSGDGGIDGRATLANKPADHASRLALAQVKGGKFNLSQLRDFLHVTDREKAALGVYVTLHPVTTPAARAAVHQTRTVTVGAEAFPRTQLWSIADYFDDRRPRLPTMTDPYTGKALGEQGTLSV